MHRRYPLLVLLSLFVVAVTAWNCSMELRFSGVPFALEPVNPRVARITPLHHMPLPPGLHPGDRVEYARQAPTTRMTLFAVVEEASVRPGHILPLIITHADGHRTRVDVASRGLHEVPALRLSIYLDVAWFVLMCLITLMTLWRGHDRAAWGIAAWAIAFLCGGALTKAPVFGGLAFGLGLASQIFYLLARVGFFVMADAIAASALGAKTRRAMRSAFVLWLVLGYAYELSSALLLVFSATLIPQIASIIWVLPYAVAAAMLLTAYHGAAADLRPRLRWMFWSSAVLVFGILLSNVPLFGYPVSYLVEILAYLIAFAGLFYSALRHRVVDMSFVLNRALVYSIALTIIVSIFMLLESFLEKIALSEKANFVLELGVPLAIGFSLEAARKRLERIGERLFFHRKFEALAALRRYARQCGYIEHPDHLLEQTLQELRVHSGARAVGFYWQQQEGRYDLLEKTDASSYPPHLNEDDRAVVALRAERESTDLERLGSTLGDDGLLIPMTARGELLGAVVIASRPGERYAPDERELLDHVVHEAGSALHALQARDHARFVAAVADGSLAGAEMVDRARALVPINPPAVVPRQLHPDAARREQG
ncbi:MAG TPA: GAF domain-containing protein [Burkholderiales bacterium]|nr:GAF domain-containing protein [Burkholderiales bacterium]